MSITREWKIFGAMAGIFGLAYYLPLANPRVTGAILEAFKLLQWYARNHTLACVVPALFIAGGITTFLSQAAVMRYLGPNSNKLAGVGLSLFGPRDQRAGHLPDGEGPGVRDRLVARPRRDRLRLPRRARHGGSVPA